MATAIIKKQAEMVAERIITKRKKAGLSQDALAELAGIDRKTVNRIENGHFSPSMETFFRIAHALRTNAKDFLK
jgi:transcriptional regulator with XRE-family HTH domain